MKTIITTLVFGCALIAIEPHIDPGKSPDGPSVNRRTLSQHDLEHLEVREAEFGYQSRNQIVVASGVENSALFAVFAKKLSLGQSLISINR